MASAAATVRVKAPPSAPIERVVGVERGPAPPQPQVDESADDDLPLPPRLPSISALLNETASQQDSTPQGGPSSGLFPPYSPFDPQAQPTYRHDVAPTAPDAAPSPSSTPAPPPPPPPPPHPHYPPVASAHPDTATQAGIAFSQSRPMARPPSPPPRQLTSLEFPDGNALHPLPSGLSPSGGRRRATSASVVPLFEAAPYNRLPGFATSSERGGAAGSGGGQLDARDQPPPPSQQHQESPSSRLEALRPRAFSTPTREEYRAHVGWAAALPAVPARAPLHFAARPDPGADQQQQHHAEPAAYPPMPPYPYYPGVHGPPSHVHVGQHLAPDSWAPHHLPLPYPPPPPQQQQHHHHSHQPPPPLPTPPSHEHPHPHGHPHQHSHQHLPPPMPSGLAAQGPASPPLPPSAQQQQPPQQQLQYSTHPTGLPGQSAWLPQPPPSLVAAGAAESPQDAGRYGCPHCPKRFARPSSLRIHMHSHTGEKPFTCPMCDRAFSVQSNLRRHLKIHKGGNAAPAGASSSSAPTPRSLPRLATDRATLGDSGADDSPADQASGSTASRPSSGSAGGLGGATDAEGEAEGEGEGEGEREEGAILEEDEGQGDGDVIMGDEARQPRKGDELRGEAPPLVRTAWPRARERGD